MSSALPLIGLVVALIGAVATAIVALVKMGPERASLEIANVDQLILRERSYATSLEERLAESEKRIEGLANEIKALRTDLGTVTAERDRLAAENKDLLERVDHLEQRVRDLSRAAGREGPPGATGAAGAQGTQGPTGPQGIEGQRGRGHDPL